MKVNTTPQTLENVERVIKKHCPDAVLVKSRRHVYAIGNFPNQLPEPIKDYINCHFEVLEDESDSKTITFKYEE